MCSSFCELKVRCGWNAVPVPAEAVNITQAVQAAAGAAGAAAGLVSAARNFGAQSPGMPACSIRCGCLLVVMHCLSANPAARGQPGGSKLKVHILPRFRHHSCWLKASLKQDCQRSLKLLQQLVAARTESDANMTTALRFVVL